MRPLGNAVVPAQVRAAVKDLMGTLTQGGDDWRWLIKGESAQLSANDKVALDKKLTGAAVALSNSLHQFLVGIGHGSYLVGGIARVQQGRPGLAGGTLAAGKASGRQRFCRKCCR